MPSDFQSYRKAEYDFLSMLRKNGFTVYAIHLPGGYFIWDDPDGKIVHFSVQECPQISFGIWFDKQDEHVTGSFFAQFDCIIDKFKPSASLYCCKIGDAVKLANRAEDAKDFIADYFSDNCSSEAEARACYAHALCCRDDITIAKQFIDNHDCNVSDNAQFEAIVRNFYRNRK